ncbi:MAG TPA: glycosyltransferase family 2 protein [Candidatus Paceibacterota bacterium]|nr:glycosyltransferase family 2 protein [Candidatus Pacearchaeota archaeon]HRZ51045.1 glycosyltransferase family 2 protein [Candidatus Paceibacterota bacterium]HSA36796.1 glycosyltransferase family 2 protein [Candidatus Paceibacterota bacterium]
MEIDYINLSKADDLPGSRARSLYRFFEILPGLLAWSTLVFALLFSWLIPFWVAFFIIAFDLYWLLRVLYLSVHQVVSYRKMKANSSVNWLKRLKKEKSEKWKKIHHLVILPVANEEKTIVRDAVLSLAASFYPKEKITVLLAIEERAGEKSRKAATELKTEFKNAFCGFFISVHPGGISGELAGKGANVNWSLREVREGIIPHIKVPLENVLVSIFDIDTKPYPHYFSRLTWVFLNTEEPLKKSYQPIPVYNNNIWDSSAVARIIATSSTFWQMMQQERTEQLVTFSSHSMPLKALLESEYPSNVVSDDSRIFWRTYFKTSGDYRVIPLHYPISLDAVMAPTLAKTMINQYKQQRRWSWGVENVPYVFFNFLMNPASKKIGFGEKFFHAFTMLEGFWSWATCSILTFCLGWLPLLLGGDKFSSTLISYNLPLVTSKIMTMAMIGMVVSAATSWLLLPPKPAKYGRWRSLSMILQWALLPVTLIVFGSIPAIESQTRMMIKKPLGFWVTEKVRK